MTVQISKIKITNRVRKEITKIAELSEDIQANGLINPITVMSLAGGEHEYRLLAGLRRLRAVELLGHDEIAVYIVAPVDAEAQLRIEVSENEYREPFTFSEKMDFARMLEAIESEKAKARLQAGQSNGGKTAGNGRTKESSSPPHGAESKNKETREIVAEKIGMGKTSYDRAKYIADNASDEIIEELDNGQRSIRGTYDELKAKEKAAKLPSPTDADDEPKSSTSTFPTEAEAKGLLSKSDLEAIERNKKFNAMSDAEKVEELQRRLKEERKRATIAESELSRLRDFHKNAVYHKDGIIANLSARLETAEARVEELEAIQNINPEGGADNAS